MEPDDIRAQHRAAIDAHRQLGQHVQLAIANDAALRTARAPQAAVNFMDANTARRLVQAIDVLRHHREVPAPVAFHRGERIVPRVRHDGLHVGPPRVVELPDECRIPLESRRRRDILDAMAFPEAIRRAERRYATFRRRPRAAQHGDSFRVMKSFNGPRVFVGRHEYILQNNLTPAHVH